MAAPPSGSVNRPPGAAVAAVVAVVALVLLLGLPSPAAAFSRAPAPPAPPPSAGQTARGEVVVTVRAAPGAARDQVEAAVAAEGGRVIRYLANLDLFQAGFPAGIDIDKTIRALKRRPEILAAEKPMPARPLSRDP